MTFHDDIASRMAGDYAAIGATLARLDGLLGLHEEPRFLARETCSLGAEEIGLSREECRDALLAAARKKAEVARRALYEALTAIGVPVRPLHDYAAQAMESPGPRVDEAAQSPNSIHGPDDEAANGSAARYTPILKAAAAAAGPAARHFPPAYRDSAIVCFLVDEGYPLRLVAAMFPEIDIHATLAGAEDWELYCGDYPAFKAEARRLMADAPPPE